MNINDNGLLFLYPLTLRALLDLGEAQFYSRSLFFSWFHKRIHIRAHRYIIIMTMQVGTLKPRTAVLFDITKLIYMHFAPWKVQHGHSAGKTDEIIKHIMDGITQRPSSLANLTVLIPVDIGNHRPRPGDVADVPTPHVQRRPEDEDCSSDAGHRAVGIEVSRLVDPRVCVEREQEAEEGCVYNRQSLSK